MGFYDLQKEDASVKKAWGSQNEAEKGQALWTRHIVFYVSFMNKCSKKKPLLLNCLPIYGPKFIPPAAPTLQSQSYTPPSNIKAFYLKPIVILHPLYVLLLMIFQQVKLCIRCIRYATMKSDKSTHV